MRLFGGNCPWAGLIVAMVAMVAVNHVSLIVGGTQHAVAAEAAPRGIDYLTQVKPLLRERCFACHGALKQEANLRLDTVKAMLAGGDSGPVVVQGDVAKSLLIQRVSATKIDERMPPEHEGEALTAAQITLLRDWISSGAPQPSAEQPEVDPRDHWSFRPITRPPVPKVQNGSWVRNPIDAFVAKQHEQHGLTAQPEASREILLRRLSLDLIGLPPTPDEIAAVRASTSPRWYEQEVQRLLKDPRHGERWGRHWMDVWRYSDWWGLGEQLRNSQKHIWHWRDWIIESLNNDVPYDQMVRLMLAGDEIAPHDLEQLRATGYLARNYFLFNRNQWMDETVEHVSKAFLGLTMNCSKCHDHKYDPLPQADFYRLRAFFEPYHVRLDVVPGEADLTRDGIPRVFDGVLDAPTYRFVRGQEANPDKSTVIEPNIPDVLRFAPLTIEPVKLPVEAWQPDRRSWVADAYRKSAAKQVVAAEEKLAAARDKLTAIEKQLAALPIEKPAEKSGEVSSDRATVAAETPTKAPATNGDAATGVRENFQSLDAKRWKLVGGNWEHSPGKLEQKQDGAQQASLLFLEEAPRDFEVSIKLTYLGGSRYRSVGVTFDCSRADLAAPITAKDSEQSVYVSAMSPGSKVQASWNQGGKWNYPPAGMSQRKVELNREHTLKVQVRDTLINASLNGELAVAWRSPVQRRQGSLRITTFDALVVFHEVSIAPLSPDVMLREAVAPAPKPTGTPESRESIEKRLADVRAEVDVAALALSAAQAEVVSVEQRAKAVQVRDGAADETLARAAAKAESEAKLAQARWVVADAKLRLQRSAENKRDAVKKDLAKAEEALKKAEKAAAEPTEQFTRFVGAQWTPTRFRSSGTDDPKVTFGEQSTGRRKALAEWITDRRNPLAARVAVNHLWNRHFGTPLVATVFDFGRKGAAPTHPELLDYLAAEFIESGWSMKHMHRLLVESATYRLSSSTAGSTADANFAKDPDNIHLWRRTPSRLESQTVRDSLLSLAGMLDATIGGPTVPQAQQADSKRRSLYFFHSNNERNLFLTMFDEALVSECYRREQSIVPQQALALTNSRLILEVTRPIAERIRTHLAAAGQPTDQDEAFVRAAFLVILASEPKSAEMSVSLKTMESWRKLPDAGTADAANLFAQANLVWVLLNHNDFISIR